MEQHLSSEVIAKDTSSLTMFDSILPGALECVSAGEPPAPAPACGRGPEAGRWCKRSWSSTPFQVVHFLEENYACLFVILPEGWKHPQISLSIGTFLRAGNRKQ